MKEDVVSHSIYACVRDAVVLRSGVRRRTERRVGVRVRVRPITVVVAIIPIQYLSVTAVWCVLAASSLLTAQRR